MTGKILSIITILLVSFLILPIAVSYFSNAQPSETISTSDTKYPGTVDQITGVLTWVNIDNIKANDGNYASISLTAGDSSKFIRATNFGFSLPSTTTTVTGIVANINRQSDNLGIITDQAITLLKNTTITGINKADLATQWPAIATTKTYGSSSDFWGANWSISDISNIGLRFQNQETGSLSGDNAHVDYVSLTVYYTYVLYKQDMVWTLGGVGMMVAVAIAFIVMVFKMLKESK